MNNAAAAGTTGEVNEFEYGNVPKFIDFCNENEDLHEKSSFFNGDALINPTPAKPAATAAVKPAGPVAAKENVPVLGDKALKRSNSNLSNLALFNHGSSRVAEKARRRSQQIQVNDSAKSPPKLRSSSRRPWNAPSASLKPAAASVKPLAKPAAAVVKPAAAVVKPTASVKPPAAPVAAKENVPVLGEKVRTRSTSRLSNLALFNPGSSRLAENARRRSQQIQVNDSAKSPPKLRPPSRRPWNAPSSPPKLRASSIQRRSNVADPQPNVQRRSNVADPQPNVLRRSILAKPQQKPSVEKPESFARNLRSYKPPTGTTPTKPLTTAAPFSLRRSTSKCRDIDPRLRASVDRLSTPKRKH